MGDSSPFRSGLYVPGDVDMKGNGIFAASYSTQRLLSMATATRAYFDASAGTYDLSSAANRAINIYFSLDNGASYKKVSYTGIVGATPAATTAAEIAALLNANAVFAAYMTASNNGGALRITPVHISSRFKMYTTGTLATALGTDFASKQTAGTAEAASNNAGVYFQFTLQDELGNAMPRGKCYLSILSSGRALSTAVLGPIVYGEFESVVGGYQNVPVIADAEGRVGIYVAGTAAAEVELLVQSVTGAMATLLETSAKSFEAKGCVPAARLQLSAQPADTNTIGIGADTYEFVDEAVNTVIGNDARIAVSIGVDAAATLANLVAAINATNALNQHATITKADTVTPAKANGTENVVADIVNTTMCRIRPADAPGGNPVAADPSIALAEAITDAADIWDVGNVNVNTLAGETAARKQVSTAVMTLTTAMLTATGVTLVFPFAVVGFILLVRSSAGVVKAPANNTVVLANGVITIADPGAGGMANGDLLSIIAWN